MYAQIFVRRSETPVPKVNAPKLRAPTDDELAGAGTYRRRKKTYKEGEGYYTKRRLQDKIIKTAPMAP